MHERQGQLVAGIAYPQSGQRETQPAGEPEQQGGEIRRIGFALAFHQPYGDGANEDAQPTEQAELGAEERNTEDSRQQGFALGQADANGIAAALEEQHHQDSCHDLGKGCSHDGEYETAVKVREFAGYRQVQQQQVKAGQGHGPDETRQGHTDGADIGAELFLLGVTQGLGKGGKQGEGYPEHGGEFFYATGWMPMSALIMARNTDDWKKYSPNVVLATRSGNSIYPGEARRIRVFSSRAGMEVALPPLPIKETAVTDYQETLYKGYGQRFRMDKLLHEVRTDHQHLVIFENARMGRVMALDGVIQTTEADEFIYHEMLAHVPLFAHGQAKRVLIIGGGDGGILREVARHGEVEHITMVEIDRAVVDMCKQFLPQHSSGAFDDPRLQLVIDDGMRFVATSDDKFDVIISDSTDPIGPGEVLFSENFYQACRRCLNDGGILVTQNGTPFMQLDEVRTTAQRMTGLFRDWHFYQAAIPTYIGGAMTFAWGACDPAQRTLPLATLRQRFVASGITTRYYNSDIHQGAFALPQYVLQAIGKSHNG